MFIHALPKDMLQLAENMTNGRQRMVYVEIDDPDQGPEVDEGAEVEQEEVQGNTCSGDETDEIHHAVQRETSAEDESLQAAQKRKRPVPRAVRREETSDEDEDEDVQPVKKTRLRKSHHRLAEDLVSTTSYDLTHFRHDLESMNYNHLLLGQPITDQHSQSQNVAPGHLPVKSVNSKY
jgi:hypothetical protein